MSDIVEQARKHVEQFKAIGGTGAYPFSVTLAVRVVSQAEEIERLRAGRAAVVEAPILLAAALVSLSSDGIAPDIQELLVRGNPTQGVKPNALIRAIEHADSIRALKGGAA
jgi:hypothetical protein